VLLHGSQYCDPSEPRVFIRTSKCKKLHSPAAVVIDSCSAKLKKSALEGKTARSDSVYAFPHPLNKLVRYLRKLHAGSIKPKSEAILNYVWPVLLKTEI